MYSAYSVPVYSTERELRGGGAGIQRKKRVIPEKTRGSDPDNQKKRRSFSHRLDPQQVPVILHRMQRAQHVQRSGHATRWRTELQRQRAQRWCGKRRSELTPPARCEFRKHSKGVSRLPGRAGCYPTISEPGPRPGGDPPGFFHFSQIFPFCPVRVLFMQGKSQHLGARDLL